MIPTARQPLVRSSDGTLDPTIQARADKFKYCYHQMDTASLLAGMKTALQKLK